MTKEDRELLAKLSQVLGRKLGKAGTASQSDLIRYSLRQLAERELGEGGTKKAKTICLAQSKGGTGKSTSTLNIGAVLAERKYRVLLVDTDQQANLTMVSVLILWSYLAP